MPELPLVAVLICEIKKPSKQKNPNIQTGTRAEALELSEPPDWTTFLHLPSMQGWRCGLGGQCRQGITFLGQCLSVLALTLLPKYFRTVEPHAPGF